MPTTAHNKPPSIPVAQADTIRRTIGTILHEGWFSAKELSAMAHVSERDVYEHLAHIQRSAPRTGGRFCVRPAQCKTCGFSFKKREKLTKPSRCPQCGGQFIASPRFSMQQER